MAHVEDRKPYSPFRQPAEGTFKYDHPVQLTFERLTPVRTIPEDHEEKIWEKIKIAIRQLFTDYHGPGCALECLAVVRDVRSFCQFVEMGANRLYQRIHDECDLLIAAELKSLLQDPSPDSVYFLYQVYQYWQTHCDRMNLMHNTMNMKGYPARRDKAKQTPEVPQLWDVGLQLFHKHLFQSAAVEDKIVTGLLTMIDKERSGEDVDKTLLDHILKMFKALGVYSESFEKPFLESTSEFYAAEGMKYMQHYSVPVYLKHVETRLNEEQERCSCYLDVSTRKLLVAIAEKQLLDCHLSAILDKGFAVLMDGSCIEDLQRMYSLFSRVNALESLGEALSSYIQRVGQGIIMGEDKEMVASLVMRLKFSVDNIWEESFVKNLDLGKNIENAFETLQAKLLDVGTVYCEGVNGFNQAEGSPCCHVLGGTGGIIHYQLHMRLYHGEFSDGPMLVQEGGGEKACTSACGAVAAGGGVSEWHSKVLIKDIASFPEPEKRDEMISSGSHKGPDRLDKDVTRFFRSTSSSV